MVRSTESLGGPILGIAPLDDLSLDLKDPATVFYRELHHARITLCPLFL